MLNENKAFRLISGCFFILKQISFFIYNVCVNNAVTEGTVFKCYS